MISAPNSPAKQITIPKEKVQQLMDAAAWLDSIFCGDIAAVKQIKYLIENDAVPVSKMSAEDMKVFIKKIFDIVNLHPVSEGV